MKRLIVWLLFAAFIFSLGGALADSTYSDIEEHAKQILEKEFFAILPETEYRTIVHRWPAPEEESVLGETWYVRFDALDKESKRSHIVGLDAEGDLCWMNIEPARKENLSASSETFKAYLDFCIERYGSMDEWDQAEWMAFATEVRKIRPESRNVWRIQRASYVPVPEDAISREKASQIAADAIGFPADAAVTCVCLEDGERIIYKIAFSYGRGWEHMVEMDCRTGEVLKTIPFESSVHSWADCYVPDSVTQAVPPENELMTNG